MCFCKLGFSILKLCSTCFDLGFVCINFAAELFVLALFGSHISCESSYLSIKLCIFRIGIAVKLSNGLILAADLCFCLFDISGKVCDLGFKLGYLLFKLCVFVFNFCLCGCGILFSLSQLCGSLFIFLFKALDLCAVILSLLLVSFVLSLDSFKLRCNGSKLFIKSADLGILLGACRFELLSHIIGSGAACCKLSLERIFGSGKLCNAFVLFACFIPERINFIGKSCDPVGCDFSAVTFGRGELGDIFGKLCDALIFIFRFKLNGSRCT